MEKLGAESAVRQDHAFVIMNSGIEPYKLYCRDENVEVSLLGDRSKLL